MYFLYHLSPFAMVHDILFIQLTCLTVLSKLAEREVERLTEWNNDKKYKQSPVTGTEGTKQVHLVKHRSPR